MKPRNNPFLAAALTTGFILPAVHGEVAPYASADADTTYLYHFDEAAGGSSAANAGSTGFAALSVAGNPYAGDGVAQPLITTVLGATGFSGFGNAANITGNACLGVDADVSGGFQPGDFAPVGPDQLTDHSTLFGASNAFTLEAMVNVPSITSGNREIICTDVNAVTADRGFQFRINSTGNLEFNFIGTATAAFAAPIPTTGTHGFAANQWFHVALTYDGTTLTYYWTRVAPSVVAANPIATNTIETVDVNDDAVLIIGNEGRSTGGLGGEPLGGLIDEVRISKVARSASQFIFALAADDQDNDKLSDIWEVLHFRQTEQETVAEIIAKYDGSSDPDSDGYANEQEETANTNPNTAQKPSDTDADGLIDSWEQIHFGSLDPLPGDLGGDGDAFTNLQEQNAGSDPKVTASVPTDIDGDGTPDSAEAFQPYTADSDTLHLWHLDEVDQPAADAGSNPVALTFVNANGRMWAPSLAGFGTGFNPSEGRGTATGGILSAKPLAGGVEDDTTLTYAGGDGAFTFEAIVRLDFNPALAPVSTAPMQILTGENDGTQGAARAWQFRLVPVGGTGNLTGTAPLLEFINLHGQVGIQTLVTPLPTNADPDAAVQGNWYHVAVAYNGSAATADNLKLYWTLLDPSRGAANEILSGQMNDDLIVTTPDLSIGNEARDNGGSTDNFLGVIDEVRISSVARAPSQFHFVSNETPDNLDDGWEQLYFGNLDQTDSGDFDNDGTDNLTEFRLGLIPNSGSSRFAATPGATAGSLQWPSATGTTFKIERSINLAGWTILEAAYPGSAGSTSYTDPAPPVGKAFYRVTLNN